MEQNNSWKTKKLLRNNEIWEVKTQTSNVDNSAWTKDKKYNIHRLNLIYEKAGRNKMVCLKQKDIGKKISLSYQYNILEKVEETNLVVIARGESSY